MSRLDFPDTAAFTIYEDLDELEVRLKSELGGRIRDLSLHLQDDGIVLCGFTRTFHAKQVAQAIVMRSTDLPIAANEIVVACAIPA